jgi:hypothetical protein
MAEVHLHPGDMRGAIVSLSAPQPPESWRWGGPGWRERSVAGRVAGIVLAVADPAAISRLWATIAGSSIRECTFVADQRSPGLTEIQLELDGALRTIRLDGR